MDHLDWGLIVKIIDAFNKKKTIPVKIITMNGEYISDVTTSSEMFN